MKDTANRKKPGSGWLSVVTDYGPLLVFFLTYRWLAPSHHDSLENSVAEVAAVVRSTGVFIAASLVALAVSKWRLGRISPMLWLSTALIVIFGGITIWTGDERVIQAKPTVLYALFAVALLVGYWRGRPLLRYLLEAAFEGLSETGWMKLSRNWGVFFIFLAILNQTFVETMSFESWLAAKLWVFLPLSFLFTFTQIPMLLRHGLNPGATDEAIGEEPPTGG